MRSHPDDPRRAFVLVLCGSLTVGAFGWMAACSTVPGDGGVGAAGATESIVAGTSGTLASGTATNGATASGQSTGSQIVGGTTSAGPSSVTSVGVTSAQAGVSGADGSGNVSAAGNQAAANGGGQQFVTDLGSCAGLTIDATVWADDDGDFKPADLDVHAGAIVRFVPIGATGMRSLSGDLQTATGETTCLAFNGVGVFAFDASTSPEAKISVHVH